jgi:hypothetical protein
MVYVPDWESLAETLTRLIATGLSMSEAQRDICRAVADRKIRFRATDNRIETRAGSAVDPRLPGILSLRQGEGPKLLVPRDLSSDDIDWEKSRPKKPWRDNNGFLVHIGKLELSTADAVRVLCGGTSVRRLPEESSAGKVVDEPVAPVAPRKRTKAADEARAMRALEAELRINDQMRAAEAMSFCTRMDISLGDRAFRRVWRNARVQAGFTPNARAGRPRKSLR